MSWRASEDSPTAVPADPASSLLRFQPSCVFNLADCRPLPAGNFVEVLTDHERRRIQVARCPTPAHTHNSNKCCRTQLSVSLLVV